MKKYNISEYITLSEPTPEKSSLLDKDILLLRGLKTLESYKEIEALLLPLQGQTITKIVQRTSREETRGMERYNEDYTYFLIYTNTNKIYKMYYDLGHNHNDSQSAIVEYIRFYSWNIDKTFKTNFDNKIEEYIVDSKVLLTFVDDSNLARPSFILQCSGFFIFIQWSIYSNAVKLKTSTIGGMDFEEEKEENAVRILAL